MQTYENKGKNITNYPVPKGTTHLMMWIGSPLSDTVRVLKNTENNTKYTYAIEKTDPNNKYVKYVDYVATLKGECKKMAKKNEACIFVYDSRMIDKDNKGKIEKIVHEIPNCFAVDYRDFIEKIKGDDITFKAVFNLENFYSFLKKENKDIDIKYKQSDFIKIIDKIVDNVGNQNKFFMNVEKASIGDLVDCMRMLLLLHPSKLKQLAIDKNPEKANSQIKPEPKDFTLLYHDFDMIQVEEKNENSSVKNGSLKDNCITACKTTGNGCGVKFENGILYAHSNEDRNEVIEKVIAHYTHLNKHGNKPMYSIMTHDIFDIKINHFSCFKDEGHRTWQLDQRKINNKEPQQCKKRKETTSCCSIF